MANDLELLVQNYATQAQLLNDAAVALLDDTNIDGAVGIQLDGLGQLVGLDRGGFDDETYRGALRGWIRVNTSAGTLEQLNEIVRVITAVSLYHNGFSIVEDFPATIITDYITLIEVSLGLITAEALYQAKAGGVHSIFKFHDIEPIFAFDMSGGSKFDGGFYLRWAIRNRGGRESEIL